MKVKEFIEILEVANPELEIESQEPNGRRKAPTICIETRTYTHHIKKTKVVKETVVIS